MRIVLFCMLLLVGQDMRAYFIGKYETWFNVLIPQDYPIPAQSLILFERLSLSDNYANLEFNYEWITLVADGDTIPIKRIDSCAGESYTQWLFKPGREMKRGKQYLFCVYFGMYDRSYGTSANCLILDNPIQHTRDNKQPGMHGLPQLLETQDSTYFPAKKVFIRINATDENAMLLKAIYTDRVTGEKYKRYFQLQSAKSDTGSVIDIGIAGLISSGTYALEITLMDLAGNQSAPILLGDDVRFNKGSHYVYAEEKRKITHAIMGTLTGLVLILAFGGLFIAVRRLSRKGKHTAENSDQTES